MMMRVFVDTSYFIARLVEQDQWHKLAVNAVRRAEGFVTSCLVLNETLSLLQVRGQFSTALEFLGGVRRNSELRIIYPDAALQSMGWDLFSRYGAAGANAVDCVSFAIMREMQIRKAFTFDTHFQEAGFEILR
jgi:predicted nucleic acid-binding protein